MGPPLRQGNLTIRPLVREDLEAVHALLEGSGVDRKSIAERASWLERVVRTQEEQDPNFPSVALGAFEGEGGPLWALARLEPRCGPFEEVSALRRSEEPSMRRSLEVVLTCVVAPAHRRQGVGAQLARAALELGFSRWDLSRIVSCASFSAPAAHEWMRKLGMIVQRNLVSPDGPLGLVGIAAAPGEAALY